MHDLNVARINCTVVSIFSLWLGYMFKKNFAYSFIKEGNTTEAINNLKKHARCPLNMLSQVIRNPLCALWMVNQLLKHSWSSKDQKQFHFRPAPGSVNLCSAESLWRDLDWKKQTEEINLALESLLINSSHTLLRDWVVHGARVL